MSRPAPPASLFLNGRSNIYLYGYLALLIVLSLVEIDDDNPIMSLVNILSELIPSISRTASISPNQNSASLILLICWLAVIPSCFTSYKYIKRLDIEKIEIINKNMCKYVGVKNVIFTYLILISCSLPLLYIIYYFNPIGGYGRRLLLYRLIQSSNIYISFWGISITLFVCSILFVYTMMVYYVALKICK